MKRHIVVTLSPDGKLRVYYVAAIHSADALWRAMQIDAEDFQDRASDFGTFFVLNADSGMTLKDNVEETQCK